MNRSKFYNKDNSRNNNGAKDRDSKPVKKKPSPWPSREQKDERSPWASAVQKNKPSPWRSNEQKEKPSPWAPKNPDNNQEFDDNKEFKKFDSENEMKVYGFNSCIMLYEKRPDDIIKIYLHEKNLKKFGDVLKFCATKKKSYKIITENDELEKITESNHHEGVCFIVKRKKPLDLDSFIKSTSKSKDFYCIALDNIENPHNTGAIVRVCANFGSSYLLVEDAKKSTNAAMIRTSEGGYEWIDIVSCGPLEKALIKLKENGFSVYTTSSHMGRPTSKINFGHKSIIVFGSESDGLSKEILKMGDALISIPSSGHVESLNVSCAASVILSNLWDKNQKPS